MKFRRSLSLQPLLFAVFACAVLAARVYAQDRGQSSAPAGQPSLETLAGDYESSGLRVQVRLRADGVLTIADAPPQPVRELVPLGNLRFAQKGLPSNTVEFMRDSAGNIRGLMLQAPYGSFFRARMSAPPNGAAGRQAATPGSVPATPPPGSAPAARPSPAAAPQQAETPIARNPQPAQAQPPQIAAPAAPRGTKAPAGSAAALPLPSSSPVPAPPSSPPVAAAPQPQPASAPSSPSSAPGASAQIPVATGQPPRSQRTGGERMPSEAKKYSSFRYGFSFAFPGPVEESSYRIPEDRYGNIARMFQAMSADGMEAAQILVKNFVPSAVRDSNQELREFINGLVGTNKTLTSQAFTTFSGEPALNYEGYIQDRGKKGMLKGMVILVQKERLYSVTVMQLDGKSDRLQSMLETFELPK